MLIVQRGIKNKKITQDSINRFTLKMNRMSSWLQNLSACPKSHGVTHSFASEIHGAVEQDQGVARLQHAPGVSERLPRLCPGPRARVRATGRRDVVARPARARVDRRGNLTGDAGSVGALLIASAVAVVVAGETANITGDPRHGQIRARAGAQQDEYGSRPGHGQSVITDRGES